MSMAAMPIASLRRKQRQVGEGLERGGVRQLPPHLKSIFVSAAVDPA
jgi:hypothetical protein